MTKSDVKSTQFSLGSMILFSTIVGIVLAISIPLIAASKRDGLYFAPYHLLGDAFFPIAVFLFLISPLLLMAIGVLLFFRLPQPALVYFFLFFIVIAVFQAFAVRPNISALLKLAQIFSPILVVLSIASIAEVAIRQVRSHLITSGLTLPVGLAYWFMTSGIISAV